MVDRRSRRRGCTRGGMKPQTRRLGNRNRRLVVRRGCAFRSRRLLVPRSQALLGNARRRNSVSRPVPERDAKQSFAEGVPKQSLGTRDKCLLRETHPLGDIGCADAGVEGISDCAGVCGRYNGDGERSSRRPRAASMGLVTALERMSRWQTSSGDRARSRPPDVRTRRDRVLHRQTQGRQTALPPGVKPEDLPSNAEIRDQIQLFARIHEGDRRTENLRDMRLDALHLMRLLRPFGRGSSAAS